MMKKLLYVSSLLLLLSCSKEICEEGFTGADCAQTATPLSINLENVFIINLPLLKPDSTLWDTEDSPDVYFEFYIDEEPYPISSRSSPKENCAELDFQFNITNRPIIPVAEIADKTFGVILWDLDNIENELIYQGAFEMDFYKQGPSVTSARAVPVDSANELVDVIIQFSYNY